ncbi:MAG: site-2 protease family protein, partial [Candidatus Aenigmatarchaeota archaeon]
MRAFTKEEIRDIIISILTVTLIFSFPDLRDTFFTLFIVVVLSFFIHEMGHKLMARRLGCMATYKLWPVG